MQYKQNLILGAALIVAAELMFATMGAAVKAASTGLPNEVIVFARNLLGTCYLLPLVLRRGSSLRTRVVHLHLLRAGVGVAAMYCFFYALGRMPLAEGMILKMTTPLFMPLFAYFWLRESSSAKVLFAIPLGFFGVWVVLDPAGSFEAVALIGLAGGALAALAKAAVRRLSHTEPVYRIVFYFALLSTLISAVPLSWAWQMPTLKQGGLLLLLAIAGTCGQLLMTRAYATGEAARIGPLTYASVIFASTYGYLFWGETISWHFITGSILIATAGVLAIHQSKKVK